MINDTVDILNPFILNFGIVFSIKVNVGADKFSTISRCVDALSAHYSEGFFIGEHFSISDIYAKLKGVRGVLDVLKVKIVIIMDHMRKLVIIHYLHLKDQIILV